MKIIFFKFLFISLLLISCSDQENFPHLTQEPEIVSGINVKSSYISGQNIQFYVFDQNENDVSNISIFYVDGSEILGNHIIHDEIGSYTVFAEYLINGQLYNTEEISYNVVNPINKVLIEDFTGTWCGYCPPVKQAIEHARELYADKISVVATHQNDQFALPQEQELTGALGPFGLPESRINRTTEWVEPYDLNLLDDHIDVQNSLAISIESHIENSSLNVSVRFVSSSPLIDHKLVVYVTKNGLIADQSNYLNYDDTSYFYGMGNPIEDYIHNDVLVHSLTGILGDNFDDTQPYDDITKTFSLDMSNSEIQVDNSYIVAFIVNSENTTINSQSAAVAEFQDFN
tara:strand:- start:121 stop:1152 length:1032 start_codon:yes stop_codon:yes gene_type:complete